VKIQHFYDERTSTLTYVVHDEAKRIGVVIDSVTDYDPKSGRTWNESNHAVARYVERERLRIPYVLDTHAHADHLSGMPYFKARYGAQTVIGWKLPQIQALWAKLLHLGPEFPTDGSQFDLLLEDRQVLDVGPFAIEAVYTPGHTPACMTYRIGDALFVGDVLFMPDYGVARCDFPDGSADALYDSVQHLYTLPPAARVFTCHDYRPDGREMRFQSTIGENRSGNIQLHAGTSREEFVRFRQKRDAELEMPVLLIPSVQVNIRAGHLPEPEGNGTAYLKVPLNVLGTDPEKDHG
jgi:glyoxylase-like metal-dependent hydrolase (beta-lactamase superfamily II)